MIPLASGKQKWALRSSRLFDGSRLHTGSPTVLVVGGRIAAVDLTGGHISADVELVDAGDCTVLPGLVDAHNHLSFEPTTELIEYMRHTDDAAMLDRMRLRARQLLHAGVTTVRDLGDRGYLAVRLAREGGPGPTILAAGPPLTRTNGHCWFLGGLADTSDEIVELIARHAGQGVDLIKIMATGGLITPGWGPAESQYTLDDLTTAVRAAHDHGLPITAHAHGRQGISDALAAGMDGLEHVSFFTDTGSEADWDLVRALADAQIPVGVTDGFHPDGPPFPAAARQRLEQRRQILSRMRAEGVRMICSSDAGISPRRPHDLLPHSIIQFTDLGFTNLEAVAAATSLAADSCRLGGRKGRVAPGHDADLLIVPGDIRDSLTGLLAPRAVIHNGEEAA
ncbi:amidohydrolase family protein [Pseudonocardiaceae bacterium YIM PH 21723]|nr:amidohydrolase family protein [Pseudonocardiaceae bacterium YIM PH 21723]